MNFALRSMLPEPQEKMPPETQESQEKMPPETLETLESQEKAFPGPERTVRGVGLHGESRRQTITERSQIAV